MGTLGTQRIAAEIQIKTRRGLVAGQTQQKVLQGLHGQLAASYVEVLQAQGAGEELLERRRYLLALLGAERVVRDV